MKLVNVVFGVVGVLAALFAGPALAGVVLAASSGALLALSGAPGVVAVSSLPAPSLVKAVGGNEALRVFELDGGGVVVFKTVGGKLVSRFYRP
jgi:hypothetical protein